MTPTTAMLVAAVTAGLIAAALYPVLERLGFFPQVPKDNVVPESGWNSGLGALETYTDSLMWSLVIPEHSGEYFALRERIERSATRIDSHVLVHLESSAYLKMASVPTRRLVLVDDYSLTDEYLPPGPNLSRQEFEGSSNVLDQSSPENDISRNDTYIALAGTR